MIRPIYSPIADTSNTQLHKKTFKLTLGEKSLLVKFDGHKGDLTIKGKATDLHISDQLASLIDLADEYLTNNSNLTCTFLFADFNTSTCKILFNLFRVLEKHKHNNKIVIINWFVEVNSDEMIETGLDFASIFNLNFNVQYATAVKRTA